MKNDHHHFPEPGVTSSHYLLCPTYSPNPKDSSFSIINDGEVQQILKFKLLEQQIFDIFAWQMNETITRLPE